MKIIKPKRGMRIGKFRFYQKTGVFTDNETSLPEEKCVWQCTECGSFRITTVGALNCCVPEPICQCCRLTGGENIVKPEIKEGAKMLGRAYRGVEPCLLVKQKDGTFKLCTEKEWNNNLNKEGVVLNDYQLRFEGVF